MTDSDAPAVSGEPSSLREAVFRAGVLGTVTAATALYAMAVTIANVALPQMQGAMAATTDQIAWVITFNIVATAIVTPMSGWLIFRFGRRRTMLCAVAGFTVASILCGTSNSLTELVVFRAFQGAFGAPIPPVAQAVILGTFPRHLHSKALSVYGMGIVLGPIFSPTIGGYLAEMYSWRWVFFLLVPIALVTFAGVWYFLRARVGEREQVRLDWVGLLALCIAVGSLQLLLDRGEREDWFNSPEIIIEVWVAAIAFYIFVVHTCTARQPFLSPHLLLDRNFSIGILLTLVFGMLFVTPVVLLPPLLQDLRGYPELAVGLLLAARSVGTLGGFFFILLFAEKIDPRVLLAMGFLFQGLSGYFMAQFDINLTAFGVAWTSCLQGVGTGLMWVPLMTITFATLSQRDIPNGAAIFHLVRLIGSSVFISISVAVVIHTAKINYSNLAARASPFNEALRSPGITEFWDLGSQQGLFALASEINRQSLMIGYINGFYLYAVTALAVVPLLIFVRWKRPDNESAAG